MFSEELRDYIIHGKEETNIEYKESIDWNDDITKIRIMRCMLAMANYKGGGVIVLGVRQKGNIWELTGMKKNDFLSYNQDVVGQYVRNHSDPLIKLELLCDETPIKNKTNNKIRNKKFCILQVSETKELPVISTKFELYNKNQPAFPQNVCIREGGVYIRSESPIGSREILDQEEWRELLYRCMERIKGRIERIILGPKRRKGKLKKYDKDKFDSFLKRDKLI